MQINVLADDIKNGNNAKDACPITLALRRYFDKDIVVARDFIRYKTKRTNKVILVPLPKKAQNYLLDSPFNTLNPFSFKLSKEAVKKLRG